MKSGRDQYKCVNNLIFIQILYKILSLSSKSIFILFSPKGNNWLPHLLFYCLLFIFIFSVDHADFDQKLYKMRTLDFCRICEVCKPGNVEKTSNMDAYHPVVIAFQLPGDVLEAIPKLKKYLFFLHYLLNCNSYKTLSCFIFLS